MRWGLFFIDNCKNIKIYYYLCQQNNQNHHDMRKLLPILFLFVTVTSWAGNVTESEALQKAKAFMDSQRATQSQRQMRLAAKSTQVSNKLTTAVKESYYVFNVGQNDGYVVVSADDRTTAILCRRGHIRCEQYSRQYESMAARIHRPTGIPGHPCQHQKSGDSRPRNHQTTDTEHMGSRQSL